MRAKTNLTILKQRLEDVSVRRSVGRVARVGRGVVEVDGLSGAARIGDRVTLLRAGRESIAGEVIRLDDSVIVLAEDNLNGIARGDRVILGTGMTLAPCDDWVGRIIDPDGQPLDGRPLMHGAAARSLFQAPPPPALRRAFGERMQTGLAVFNTFLPVVRGQRIGLFAGSGVGKSTLLGTLAQTMSADVVVIALIGERGRELRHFADDVLGPAGLARAVVVTATSDESPLVRRRCAWAAMTVAEHFRDQGKSVLFLADSVTRFAEAHREIAVAAGEAPVLRGYPPSTAHMITSLCERAGPGSGSAGDISAVFSVLVAGSDMEEPIADIMRGVLDGHVVLDREIAERGRFPAIDLLRSVSRSLPDCATKAQNELIGTARRHLGLYAKNEMMISAGLYNQGSDPDIDRAVALWPALDAYLGEAGDAGIDQCFTKLAMILRRAAASGHPASPSRGGGQRVA